MREYEDNLEKIVGKLKRETTSVLVWATTTPIIAEQFYAQITGENRVRLIHRYEKDVHSYNDTALKVMAKHEVPVNDLYRVVEDFGKDRCISADGVHMTGFGYRVLAEKVADAVRALKIRLD